MASGFNNNSDLPRCYDENKAVLMVKDAWNVYAYWEIKKQTRETTKEAIKRKGLLISKDLLRVYDVTQNNPDLDPKTVFNIELKIGEDSCHICTGEPGRKWMVEVGMLCSTGEFFSLARSNTVETPFCDKLAGAYTEDWLFSRG